MPTKKTQTADELQAVGTPAVSLKPKPSAKKIVKKKSPSKKKIASGIVKESVDAKPTKIETINVGTPAVTITEDEIHEHNKPLEIHRKIVLTGVCTNCEHIPMNVSKLVTILSVVIIILSCVIIFSANPLDIDLKFVSAFLRPFDLNNYR